MRILQTNKQEAISLRAITVNRWLLLHSIDERRTITTTIIIMDDVNAQQNVGYAAHEVNPTDYDDTVKSRVDGTQLQSYKTQKSKYPPPSNELIFGHNENDVLLGRGATTNIHSGNQHFRNICAMRKPDFDAATNAQKRQIAIETVQTILALDPPGHFLERVEGADEVTINDDGTAFFGALGGNKNVDIHGLMSPSNAKHLSEMGGAQNKTSKHWKWAVGPWRDVGMEKAINKTLAVLRDHGRQDRIALKAMGLMKKSSKKMNALGVSYLFVSVSCLLVLELEHIFCKVSSLLSRSGRRENRITHIRLSCSSQNCSRIKYVNIYRGESWDGIVSGFSNSLTIPCFFSFLSYHTNP